MKLENFLKLFDGLDPKLEVGIFGPEHFSKSFKIDCVNSFDIFQGKDSILV